jgi:hypothetical protein
MNVLGNCDNWLGKIIKTVQISILFFVGGKVFHTSGSVIQLIKLLSPYFQHVLILVLKYLINSQIKKYPSSPIWLFHMSPIDLCVQSKLLLKLKFSQTWLLMMFYCFKK